MSDEPVRYTIPADKADAYEKAIIALEESNVRLMDLLSKSLASESKRLYWSKTPVRSRIEHLVEDDIKNMRLDVTGKGDGLANRSAIALDVAEALAEYTRANHPKEVKLQDSQLEVVEAAIRLRKVHETVSAGWDEKAKRRWITTTGWVKASVEAQLRNFLPEISDEESNKSIAEIQRRNDARWYPVKLATEDLGKALDGLIEGIKKAEVRRGGVDLKERLFNSARSPAPEGITLPENAQNTAVLLGVAEALTSHVRENHQRNIPLSKKALAVSEVIGRFNDAHGADPKREERLVEYKDWSPDKEAAWQKMREAAAKGASNAIGNAERMRGGL